MELVCQWVKCYFRQVIARRRQRRTRKCWMGQRRLFDWPTRLPNRFDSTGLRNAGGLRDRLRGVTRLRMKPIVQISLDLTEIDEALSTAAVAMRAGVDWLEAGTP